MRRVAVILSGCGFRDGAEITESISTLICLSELKAEVECFAPKLDFSPTNHLNSSQSSEVRNTLFEAARISRGHISDLDTLDEKKFDAIVLPGGFGVAQHLSDFAKNGAKAKVLPSLESRLRAFHKNSKPIGGICIAPAVIALTLAQYRVTVTIGNDPETIKEIEKTGAQHVVCSATDYISDRDNKVLTTPAYMFDAKPHEVFTGVRAMLRELVEMA